MNTKTLYAILALSACSLAPGAARAADLSLAQKHEIASMIDDACSDAWCEAGAGYDFDGYAVSLHETAGGTGDELLVRFRYTTHEPNAPRVSRWATCKVASVRDYDDVVEKFANGYTALRSRVFDELNECIMTIVSKDPS
jgi:hypothetical protein